MLKSAIQLGSILPFVLMVEGLSGGCSKADPKPPPSQQGRSAAEPGPPSSLETKETSIFKLKIDAKGELVPASGDPYFLETFLSDGSSASGFSANFSNTRFDLKNVGDKKQRGQVGLAVQKGKDREFTATVEVDAHALSWFYIDPRRQVFPPGVTEVQKGGPFLTLVFHDEKYNPLPSTWLASVATRGHVEEKRLGAKGDLSIDNVGQLPIKWHLRAPEGNTQYSGEVYPRFVGATPSLVVYNLWKVNSETYKINPHAGG